MDKFNPYENPENNQGSNTPPWGRSQMHTLPRVNYFEIAAWSCGLCSIFSCLTFYGPFVLGSMAVLFALLSRGGQMSISRKSKRGIILGIASMVLTTIIFVAAFVFLLNEYGSIEGILREFCNLYGYDFEALYGDIFAQ